MTTHTISRNPWDGDLLGFSNYGETFTNVIKSIDDTKVISIEAGFGHGKTFFRKAWAEHLKHAGELVVEIDAQQSDHSGDPIITFLGALLAVKPQSEDKPLNQLRTKATRVAGMASRAVARAVLKNGAEEIIDLITEKLTAQAEGSQTLEGTIAELQDGMSRLAGQLIASQLAAEQAREKELPQQIDAIRAEIVNGRTSSRIVILIDELDRCHPEYAIALLEAMKLVFGRPGFVFCLMVNAEYLESIARHRFGTSATGEKYLEKFVDIRLHLRSGQAEIRTATIEIAKKLPLIEPFGKGEAVSVKTAAELAGSIASTSDLSFRQVKRILDRVELALRCYGDRPLDLPLLIFLAFSDVARKPDGTLRFEKSLLRRAALNPQEAKRLLDKLNEHDGSLGAERGAQGACVKFVSENCPELKSLPSDRYKLPEGREYAEFYKVLAGLGPNYLQEHKEVLAAIHKLMA